eukprot:TRINITY_DN1141_c0_g2_i1.p1 TRINITY_DN1141_c0_g2~~TRINITY_DN1141_c0_g2_i1.p1  ORF type:complete len:206 (+),score=53.14 TRINITY_DN1141_c0_g2_i1:114-731(+)
MLRSLVGSEMCIRDRVSTQSTGLSTMTCPRWISVLLLALCLASANNSSCGGDRPSKVKDCDHTDLGSCGNSCCGIEIQLPDSPEEVYNVTTSFLKGGGDDGSYTYVTGKGPGGQDPGDDLRHFGIAYQFIFQGSHTTTGGYLDTIDFNIRKDSGTGSIIRIFTISDIHGALGDNGQGYKNVAYMMGQVQILKGTAQIFHGCGKTN